MSVTTATTAMPSKTHDADAVRRILRAISTEGQRLEQSEPGSHEALLEQARALVTELESPLETIYGFMLAEVINLLLREATLMTRGTAQSPLCQSHGSRSQAL